MHALGFACEPIAENTKSVPPPGPPPAPTVKEGSREAFPVIDLSAWTSEEDGKREEGFPASLRALESSNQVSVSLQAHSVRG